MTLSLEDEVSYFKKIDIALIVPFGRGGSFFLHGLLEGNSNISTFPIPVDMLYFIRKGHNRLKLTIDFFSREFIPLLEKEGAHFSDTVFQDFQYFVEFFYHHCETKNQLTLIRAFHFAWSKVLNQKIDEIQKIVWHPHVHDHYYRSFSINHKDSLSFILCYRDPRESLVSTYLHWQQNNFFDMGKTERTHYIYHERILYYIFTTLEIFYDYYDKKTYLLNLPLLNLSPEDEIKKICHFLNCNFKETMLQSSILGKTKDNISTRKISGFSTKANQTRWEELLSKKATYLVENIYFNQLKFLDYKIKSSINQWTIIKTIVFLFSTIYLNPFYQIESLKRNYKNATSSKKLKNYPFKPLIQVALALKYYSKVFFAPIQIFYYMLFFK